MRNAKDRLKAIISKKFDTATIFPLSQFEDFFGHLWGHKSDFNELTPEQLELREKWREVRENILDKGNQQKRNALKEIELYEVKGGYYKITFRRKQEDE